MVSSRSIKSAVYKMNSIGNRTTTLWHSEPDDFWCRPSGTVSDALHPARQEGLESVQRSNTNNEGDLEPCLQIVVDGIKNCGQVDQRIDRQVTVIDCIHCVSKNIPDVFSYNSRKYCRIFVVFGRNITEKVSNTKCYIFSTHLINAPVLPCKTENTVIVFFYCVSKTSLTFLAVT